MRLRDVELDDVSAYVQMRCDPVMMAGLGGPLPREGIEDKVARDVQAAAAGEAWIKMIIPGRPHRTSSRGRSRCGPMTRMAVSRLPRSAGWSCRRRGLAKRAVRMLLELARDDGRPVPSPAGRAAVAGARRAGLADVHRLVVRLVIIVAGSRAGSQERQLLH